MSRTCWTVEDAKSNWVMHCIDRGPGPDIEAEYRALIAVLGALKVMNRRESFRATGHASVVVNQVNAKGGQVDKAVRPLRNEVRLLIAQLKRAGCKINLTIN